METRFTELPVEVIDWLDHHTRSDPDDWRTREKVIEDSEPLYTVRDVGFVMHENEQQVTLVRSQSNWAENPPKYSDRLTIMKPLIVKRARLRKGKSK